MKKLFLMSLLLVGSTVFADGAKAAETEVKASSQKDSETIYFDENQELLITDDVIIRKISDNPIDIKLANLSPKYNHNYSDIVITGAGEWDLLGDETVGATSGIYPSRGGDYRVVVSQSKFGPYLYALKEDSPGISLTVKNFNFSGTGTFEMIFRDISGYCDGSDGLAEFYIFKSTMQSTKDYISFWD